MLYQVVIKDPTGKIKKIISSKKLEKKFWKDMGITLKNKKTYKKKKKQNWVCETCKEIFQAARTRKFCHDPCVYVDKRHGSLAERLCEKKECNNKYFPTSNVQKFCPEHKGKYVYVKKPPPLKRPCLVCREPFQPKTYRDRYCKDPCTHYHTQLKGFIPGQKPKIFPQPPKKK